MIADKDVDKLMELAINRYRGFTKKDLEDRLGALAEECWEIDKQREEIIDEIRVIERLLRA